MAETSFEAQSKAQLKEIEDTAHLRSGLSTSFLDTDSSELSFLAVRDKDRILQLLSESTGNILDDEARLL